MQNQNDRSDNVLRKQEIAKKIETLLCQIKELENQVEEKKKLLCQCSGSSLFMMPREVPPVSFMNPITRK